MVTINVLKKGDSVLSINERFLAIARKGGTVDIYSVYYGENGVLVDPLKTATIGYGEGTVETEALDGETTLFQF